MAIVSVKLETIRKWLLLAGWFCIFALYPLGNTSAGSVFLLLALVLGGWPRKLKAQLAWPEYMLLSILSGIILLSALFAAKPVESLTMGVGQILVFLLIFQGTQYLVTNRARFESIYLAAVYLAGIVSGIIAIIKYIFKPAGILRTETLFTGINGTGTVLLITMALSIVYIWSWHSARKKWAGLAGLAVPFTGMLLTFSRGAYLGFVGTMFTLLFRSKKAVALFLLFCIVMGGAILFLFPTEKARLMSIFSFAENDSRMAIWQTALNMAKDNLLLGVGPGMFAYRFDFYRPVNYPASKSLAHNLELQVLAEFGMPGLLVFLTLLGLVIWRNCQLIKAFPEKLLYRGVLAALIGYLIHNQVDGTMVGFEVGTFFWVLLGFIVHEYYHVLGGRGGSR